MNRSQLVSKLKLSGNGVEIGVQNGAFSKAVLSNSSLHLYLIDSWRHIDGYNDIANVDNEKHLLRLATTISTLREFDDRITIIREFSEKASALFRDNFFDFIYLDANHSYKSVCNDLKLWFPKLKKGGVIAGHDYLDKLPVFEVKRAVDEFFAERKIQLTDEPNFKTWFVEK